MHDDSIRHKRQDYDYNNNNGNDLDEEEDGSDYGDEEDVKLDAGFNTVIVIDNVPVVDAEKFDRLKNVMKKYASQMGTLAEDGEAIILPKDQDGKTKGFAFVEFTTPEAAEHAVQQLNGYKLDKQHIFKVTRLEDYLKLADIKSEYQPPPVKPYEPKEDLYSWLLDERSVRCIDQYVLRQGDLTDVYWNDIKANKPVLEVSRPKWTDTYVQWSPLGTYLVTHHRQGLQLWGGSSWQCLMRFNHPGVKLCEFSPSERYLVSVSPQFQDDDDPKNPKCIIIWDVRTGKPMRGFQGAPPTKDGPPAWPVFHWTHDDRFFARLGENAISVYETPSMGLLDKTSIKVEGVRDLTWSPTQPILAYFVPESGNIPAKVVLVEMPTKREIRQKNLFNVNNIKMHWQSNGQFLAVKVDRHAKNKKSTFVNFELFRMREKDIPIELLEIRDPVHAFAWEPKAGRFAIIHGEAAQKPDVSFYTMGTAVKLLKTVEKKAANSLFWSPKGVHVVLAGLRNHNVGQLEFFNADTMETMGNDEHPMCTGIDWDYTGRYVVTTVSHWRHTADTGYNMYTFAGKLITKVLRDRFYQFLWRPRPPSFLSEKKEAEIRRNIKQYSDVYEAEDVAELRKVDLEKRRYLASLRQEFHELLREREDERRAERAKRGVKDVEESDYEMVEEWVEQVIEETVEIIDDDDDDR